MDIDQEHPQGTTVEVQLLPTQMEVLHSDAKNILVTGGLGSGKTATGAHWILKMANAYPEARGLIASNTYKQLTNASVQALKNELTRLGMIEGHHFTITEKMITIGRAEILLYSLENYEALAGIEVGYVWVDEAAFCKEEAYRTVKERVRSPLGPCQILLTSTTNGFNWLYDRFVTRADADHVTYKMLTSDNFFLPKSYYTDLVAQYGGVNTPLARQQLYGEFVNMTSGQVYSYFRDDHITPTTFTGGVKYIGVDFNIGNMNALVCEIYDNTIHVIDEINLKGNSGTHELAQELISRYGTYNVEIIPDSTGSARKTSSNTTDHSILRQAGFKLNTLSKNPFIEERQKELNHIFLMNRMQIHPRCKLLISELHKLTHEDDEGKVAHLSVALGYIAYRFNIAGIRRNRKTATFRQL